MQVMLPDEPIRTTFLNYVHKNRRSTDIEALKLWKGSSGMGWEREEGEAETEIKLNHLFRSSAAAALILGCPSDLFTIFGDSRSIDRLFVCSSEASIEGCSGFKIERVGRVIDMEEEALPNPTFHSFRASKQNFMCLKNVSRLIFMC